MKIFDDIVRIERPRRENESIFEYANCSDRPIVAEIRSLLEDWFENYPDCGDRKRQLRGRLRSTRDAQFQGAFYELYLHELLCSFDYGLEIEPTMIGGTPTHPDYKVSVGGRPCFYLETTIASPSETEVAEDARIAQFFDSLNRMNSPNFLLSVCYNGVPASSRPCRPLRQELEHWLSLLDADEIAKIWELDGIDRVPRFEWRYSDWELKFTPIPKKPKVRGQLAPVIGTKSGSGAKVVDIHVAVRKAIKEKATKYGEMDLPYIVAVNIIDPFACQDDLLNALFGERRITVPLRGRQIKEWREPDGAWFGPKGPHNTRVSAVLAGYNLTPLVIARRAPELIHNPWASRPLPQNVWPLCELVPDLKSDRIEKIPGKRPLDFLDLPHPWSSVSEN